MTSTAYGLSATATGLSFFITGAMSSISLLTIPVVLEQSTSHAQRLQYWRSIYLRGKIQGPALAVVAGSLHILGGYLRRSSLEQLSRESILAACATVAIYPFTLAFMRRTNDTLMTAANGEAEKDLEEEARLLVVKWRQLNLLRALLPMIGGALGLISLFSK